MTTKELCGRETTCGAGIHHECQRPKGHEGAHVHRWVDRDGVSRLGLSWTHENYMGQAVWPEAKGAILVAKEG